MDETRYVKVVTYGCVLGKFYHIVLSGEKTILITNTNITNMSLSSLPLLPAGL